MTDLRILVDAADQWALETYKWKVIRHTTKTGNLFYAQTWIDVKMVYLHRFLMDPSPGQKVDHRNCNGLDNRRSNLRIATGSQNLANQRKRTGCSSQYKGVCWHKAGGWWRADIQINKRRLYLGHFASEENAAKAYDTAALTAWGKYARLNFPT